MFTSLIYGKQLKNDHWSFLNNRAPIRSLPDELIGQVQLKRKSNHLYLECGEGKPLIFCHGLFGGIYNINKAVSCLLNDYRFIMPFLPMYDLALSKCRVRHLGCYIEEFLEVLDIDKPVLIGSSMGGGAAAYFASVNQANISGLVLCGSSGLSNIPISTGFFKRKNYQFVSSATQEIFYDKKTAPEEMINDVFHAIQSTELVIRSIRFTKSAVHDKMQHELSIISAPTLLLWGKHDPVTPVQVAPVFNKLIKNSELHIFDNCGHVPSQEKPEQFLNYLYSFLHQINY